MPPAGTSIARCAPPIAPRSTPRPGQTIQDFTDDRKLLHEALGNLRMRPVTGQGTRNRCPNMTYYMADQIQNKHDPTVLDAATLDVMSCMSLDPMTQYAQAQQMAQQAAQQELNLGDHETRLAMGVIKDLVRRMAAMPGQRSIILVSNGFVTLPEHSTEKTEIMDRAIRASVLINSLDARGLYTDTPDITRQGTNYRTEMVLHQMERETNRAQSDVLAELAAGTGATLLPEQQRSGRRVRAPGVGAGILLPAGLLSAEPEDGRQFPLAEGDAEEREGRQRQRAYGLLCAASIWRMRSRPRSAKSKRRCSRARR